MTDSNKQWERGGMRHPREDCNVSADFVIEGRIHMGIVKNKSNSGVFVEAMESFSNDQEITITFTVPGERKPIKRKGKIVRAGKNGFGVAFNYM